MDLLRVCFPVESVPTQLRALRARHPVECALASLPAISAGFESTMTSDAKAPETMSEPIMAAGLRPAQSAT